MTKMDYDNNMRGVLFENNKTKDTQPDLTGSCEIEGVEYRLSAWKKKSAMTGKFFLSISIQYSKGKQENKQSEDCDIPF